MERKAELHPTALSDDELAQYSKALAAVSNVKPKEVGQVHEVAAVAVRRYLAATYVIEDDVVEKILRIFHPNPVWGDTLSPNQFFAVLRLVSHVQRGREVDRKLIFAQTPPPIVAGTPRTAPPKHGSLPKSPPPTPGPSTPITAALKRPPPLPAHTRTDSFSTPDPSPRNKSPTKPRPSTSSEPLKSPAPPPAGAKPRANSPIKPSPLSPLPPPSRTKPQPATPEPSSSVPHSRQSSEQEPGSANPFRRSSSSASSSALAHGSGDRASRGSNPFRASTGHTAAVQPTSPPPPLPRRPSLSAKPALPPRSASLGPAPVPKPPSITSTSTIKPSSKNPADLPYVARAAPPKPPKPSHISPLIKESLEAAKHNRHMSAPEKKHKLEVIRSSAHSSTSRRPLVGEGDGMEKEQVGETTSDSSGSEDESLDEEQLRALTSRMKSGVAGRSQSMPKDSLKEKKEVLPPPPRRRPESIQVLGSGLPLKLKSAGGLSRHSSISLPPPPPYQPPSVPSLSHLINQTKQSLDLAGAKQREAMSLELERLKRGSVSRGYVGGEGEAWGRRGSGEERLIEGGEGEDLEGEEAEGDVFGDGRREEGWVRLG